VCVCVSVRERERETWEGEQRRSQLLEREKEKRNGRRQREEAEEEEVCAQAVESPVADRLVESLALCLPPSVNTEPCTALQKMRAWRIPHILLSPLSDFFCSPVRSSSPLPLSLFHICHLLSNAEQMQCILRNLRFQSIKAFMTSVRRKGGFNSN